MDYKEINRQTWNTKTDIHIASEFYDMKAFMEGKNSLKDIELALLGDVSGKDLLHLQCHFGQDTLSLARMGAHVTGLDISDKAIQRASELADDLHIPAKFVCCDLYDTRQYINEKFDIVFSTYGTIIWLPDLDRWARVIAESLKLGGRFVFAEFHPVIWMFDDNFENVAYSYFNVEAIQETVSGTYADKDSNIRGKTVTWNHSLAEVMQALIDAGLRIVRFKEYDYSPYPIFSKLDGKETGRYRVGGFQKNLPLVYSLVAEK